MNASLGRRVLAEAVGTCFLLMAVVGSGVAALRLAPEDPAVVLLVNSVVSGAALAALILALQPVSAALNPAVTLAQALRREVSVRDGGCLVSAQVAGASAGVVLAHLMFGLPALAPSTTDRLTGPHLLAEVVATTGLVLVVLLLSAPGRTDRVAAAVACYVVAAYWFTSSTSFANPAVTVARALTDSYAGIAPGAVAAFVAAQVAGALVAVAIAAVLAPVPRHEEAAL